jgi:carotenoid 1,2-hydratase
MSVNAPPALEFDRPVAPNGYAWWYVDALSADGERGLTIIAMLGSVFSPYYARARARGGADPLNHCALNAVLYGQRARHWAMTERGRDSLHRSVSELHIGPSALIWQGGELAISVNESTAPWRKRLQGLVRVKPCSLHDEDFALDAAGRHHWRPIAPRCEVEVQFSAPAIHWRGSGYFDSNWGERALEHDFKSWTWSRLDAGEATTVLYDLEPRDGDARSLALGFDAAGAMRPIATPPQTALPSTRWGIARRLRADDPAAARVESTLESAPFYARSVVSTQLGGTRLRGMHESLSLERFRAAWVQALLPVRAPRAVR